MQDAEISNEIDFQRGDSACFLEPLEHFYVSCLDLSKSVALGSFYPMSQDWSAEWYFLSLAGGTSVLVTASQSKIGGDVDPKMRKKEDVDPSR